LNKEAQLLAFFAGANSIFMGDKLLTTPNARLADDQVMLSEMQA
jgi:biotin synthase